MESAKRPLAQLLLSRNHQSMGCRFCPPFPRSCDEVPFILNSNTHSQNLPHYRVTRLGFGRRLALKPQEQAVWNQMVPASRFIHVRLAAVDSRRDHSQWDGSLGGLRFRVLTARRSEHNPIVVLDFEDVGCSDELLPQRSNTGNARKHDETAAAAVLSGARVLFLDDSSNVSSLWYRDRSSPLTGSYWDVLASVIPLLPSTPTLPSNTPPALSASIAAASPVPSPPAPPSAPPVALLGLAGGSVARVVRQLWPWVPLFAWELDRQVVDVARDCFGLASLEQRSAEGGSLVVVVGDALSLSPSPSPSLSPSPASEDPVVQGSTEPGSAAPPLRPAPPPASLPASFSGLLVDLFAGGAVLPELSQPATWRRLAPHLLEGGRVVVNCGGPSGSAAAPQDSAAAGEEGGLQADAGVARCQGVVDALAEVFGAVQVLVSCEGEERNVFAMTGPLGPAEAEEWAKALPEELQKFAGGWEGQQSVAEALALANSRQSVVD